MKEALRAAVESGIEKLEDVVAKVWSVFFCHLCICLVDEWGYEVDEGGY